MDDGFDGLFDLQMGRLVERLLAEAFVVIAADRSPLSTEDRPDPAAHLKAELRNGGFGFIQTGRKWVQVLSDDDHRSLLFVPMMTPLQASEVMAAVSDTSEEATEALGLVVVEGYGRDTSAGATALVEEAASRDGSDFLAATRSDGRRFRVGEMGFRPERVRLYRERFRSAAADNTTRAPRASLYQLHAYAGNPPPMLPKNGITKFDGDLPGVGSLIAYVPFVLPDHPG